MIALLLTAALHCAPLGDQVTPQAIAAVDSARADAVRDFATTTAAVAAYKRVERLREALLSSGDPRVAIWLTDAAEDALLVGMNADGAAMSCLVGLAPADARERSHALVQQAIAWAQRADECARRELAEGTASPALAARLDTTERARRIPLLRAVAAIWAARMGAIPAADATAIVESSLARLQSIAPQLQGSAQSLAELAMGCALVQLGRNQEATSVLGSVVANTQLERGARVLAIALLAECSSRSAVDQRRALAAHRARHNSDLDDSSRLLLGDVDFRFAMRGAAAASGTSPTAGTPPTAGTSGPPPWQGWLDALAAAAPARKGAVRQAVLERIAANATGSTDPIAQLATALQLLRADATRERGAADVAAVLGAPNAGASSAIPLELRTAAEFELGRAELELGRARDGAVRLLKFAQEHGADPSSRTAIDVAVVAARSIGDAALLATVLDTAIARFPEHPDHAAWRVEAAALSLSPDATLLVEREPAPRRYARALDALDRAERTEGADIAVRADLVVAAAEAANELRHADDALAVLGRVLDPVQRNSLMPGIPLDLRTRLLEERIAALALAQRVVESDRWIAAERDADATATADACARVLRRQIPIDLASGLIEPPPAETRARITRLAQTTLRLAGPTPERDEVVVCALLLGGAPDLALPVARRLAESRPNRADTVLALAEAIYATGDLPALAESMQLHTRLSQSCADGSAAWWIAELRRLQTLERVNKNLDVIAPRVARLQAAHPELGGAALQAQFLALAARHEESASASAAPAER